MRGRLVVPARKPAAGPAPAAKKSDTRSLLLRPECTVSMTLFKASSVALFLSICLFGSPAGHAQNDPVLPADEPVGGLSQAEWSRAWWQWAGSFERSESPVADTTGELCDRKQSGAVWFLAGTYGTRRTVRTCRVPRGTYLFFPLINYVVMPRTDRPTSCMAVMSSAASMTNDVAALVLDIDGVRVQNLVRHRQATPQCFDMGARAEPRIRVFPSAANGYYVMLRPLSPGRHTLNFGGALPSMLQAVTYTLHVE
ncbi:hypothetical protein OOT46_03955 [Aquabacterium sp. A7-Y]|uniref:hypothetical protein n=1 Tax=Aquabacterium sp. A7-Y TaxID=1349605 RepID=UPI00223DD198|nr:hypothetical protein [Aquabacterium sp. A7-Y]MCW7537008.1 hypothetical protein [Aquabacterium sp. A7-Y]